MLPVHIGYLTDNEAKQLIEQPVKDFVLRYQPEATQKIIELTRCHPALIQLLCREIVFFKNQQPVENRFLVTDQDVNAAIPEALKHGVSIFSTFEDKATKAGQAILRDLAKRGPAAVVKYSDLQSHYPENLDTVLDLLMQLELLEKQDDNGYRFQIELFRLYFSN